MEPAPPAACDELDNVKDGIIQDPRKCNFDPAKIQCAGADNNECLTPAQVATVKTIYGGLKDPTGKQFWPPYEIGTELFWANRLATPVDRRWRTSSIFTLPI